MFKRTPLSFHTYSILQEAKKVCLFATWSQDENIGSDEEKLLTEMNKYYDIIVICTNKREIQNIPEKCICIQTEQNAMRDFGLWIRVLLEMNIMKYEKLALVNDSIKRLGPMSLFIQDIRTSQSDLAGVTNSYERSYHLQSYFLEFQSTKGLLLLLSWLYTSILPKIEYYVLAEKDTIINDFEVGLSKYFVQNNAKLYAAYPIEKLNKVAPVFSRNRNTNASYFFWDRLLLLNCPFIKKAREHYPDEDKFLAKYQDFT